MADRAGAGVASSTITANQTIELPVRMEDAGTVKGSVKRSDGTIAANADVTLTLVRNAMVIKLLDHANSQGIFTFENVPSGIVSINVNDPQTGGTASASGLSLSENGQVLDAGTLILDNTAINIESISPVNGKTDVARNTHITLTFSEPALANSINQNTVKLLKETGPVVCGLTLSNDGLRATLTPSNLLEDFTIYTVIVTTGVRDLAGIALVEEFRSSFVTRDESAPVVTSVKPINNAIQVDIDTEIIVAFNEALDTTQNLTSVVNLLAEHDMNTQTAGTISLDDTGRIVTFRPVAALSESATYTIRVTGQRDQFGNTQTEVFTSRFTADAGAPEITAVTPLTGGQHGGTRVTLAGSRLLNSNGTSPIITIADQVAVVINSTTGSTDSLTLITPAGAPGSADITITTDRGAMTLTGGFTYEADARMPFALEPDTRLLWRLDETTNGAAQVLDSGPLSIGGTAHALSQSRPGRFGGGRASAEIKGDTSFGSLAFGASSFTVEVWMKSGPVQRSYTLAGRGQNRPAFVDSEDFAVVLRPTGALEGYLFDTGGRMWLASMAPAVYDVDDDQWHAVAMVVDRVSGILKLYVDGAERATATAPTNFAALRSLGRNIVAGTFTRGGENGPGEFPGTIDEVRFSASPHPADKIASDLFDVDSVRVTATTPGILQKGVSSQFRFSGTGLTGVTASAARPDVTVDVTQTTFSFIDLTILAQESVPLGSLEFSVTNSTGDRAVIDLIVVDQKPFENDPTSASETILLWHLDESGNGAVTITGAGDAILPSIINATSSAFSFAESGRFGGARRKADIVATQISSSFQLGTSSFTVECWIKSAPVIRRYALVTRSDFIGNTDDFSLVLHPSGVVEAFLFDTTGKKWQTLAQPVTYSIDQSTIARVDDGSWHLITMVVDRLTEHLSIYVDGQQRAIAAAPGGFGALRNVGHPFRVGLEEAGGESGGREFTGVIDEVRIVGFARTAEQIRTTWFGANTFGQLDLRVPQKTTAFSPKGGKR